MRRFNNVERISGDATAIYYHGAEAAQRIITPAIALLQRYEIAIAEIRKLDQSAKIPEFKKQDFEQMTRNKLYDWLRPAGRIVRSVEATLDALRTQKEVRRKAGLSEIETLKEELADLRAHIALLERRMGPEPDMPTRTSLGAKLSSASPMLIATAQRGGGAVTKFFEDDEAEPPSGGGVRRVGQHIG